MPLIVHRAPRTDALADSLADLLLDPLPDPFDLELVLVPALGIERWLSQRLSHRLGRGANDDGVCAGVEFRHPRSLVAEVIGAGDDDPWSPDHMVWPLLRVLDEHAGEQWCATLDQHLGFGVDGEEGELRRGRRYAVARRLAALFASYAVQRPWLLADWEQGHDGDGAKGRIAADLAWQPLLWRHLVEETGVPSPVQRHAAVVAALGADVTATDLPARLSLFGHTRIPSTEAELLGALGRHRDVHIWLPHPSDTLWRELDELRGPVLRTDDPSHTHVRHPLLASLGRDLRELQRGLVDVADRDELVPDRTETGDHLLGWLQHDMAANTVDGAARRIDDDDRSVQVHACHGPARQVEVLREVILGLLADDPTLEPRDIVVMCPDIEAYAPLVESAFGLGDVALHDHSGSWHPGHRLHVRLADRSLTQTNPLLGVVGAVVNLAGGRASASAVLDLIAAEPVRRRFGFSEDDLDTITRWIEQAGIRWAYDQSHRAEYGLEKYVQNTWRFGLDRVLAGVAVSDDAQRWFGTTLPLDDVGSTNIDLAGRLAELVDRLQHLTDRLGGTHPVDHWLDNLREAVVSLTTVAWGEEWQLGQVQRELAALAVDVSERTELRLSDVRALVDERLSGRPTRANFRSGALTVCTMVPMRSVPHRVVCLLGLDDGIFPRSRGVDGDDVLARTPLTGERDIRSEDRQLLLDAVFAATEHLIVTYTGADEISGQSRPPSVPVGELLDALDTTAPGGREHATHDHPLQAFDRRNLVAGEFNPREPFSFDPAALTGARAAARPRQAPAGFLGEPLPPLKPADVDLATLAAFFRHPVATFLRRRIGISLPDDGKEVSDSLPVDVDNLVAWGIGDRLLRERIHGADLRQALELEWRRGVLPPGQLGWRRAKAIMEEVEPLAQTARAVMGDHAVTSLDVDVVIDGARRLRGTVTDVYGDAVVKATYSRLAPKHQIDAWLSLVALCAAQPGREWRAGAIGRGFADQAVAQVVFGRIDDAAAVLRTLVAIFDAGMREPLPLPLLTGYAWAQTGSEGAGRKAADGAWSKDKFKAEVNDPFHIRVWGHDAPLDLLLRSVPAPGEEYEGESTRLGALARRLWQPILEAART